MGKYRAGDICPRTATWGLFRDDDGEAYPYTGPEYDRYVRKGRQFPELEPGCHYRILTSPPEPVSAALCQTPDDRA